MSDTERLVEQDLENNVNTQWQKSGNTFSAAGTTVDKLPPGYYELVEHWGQPRFHHVPVKVDGILRISSGVLGDLINDLSKFWDSKERYKKFQLPYKRGILMSGPPGTGKTTVIKLVMMDVIKRGGVIVNPVEFGVLGDALQEIRKIQPNMPLVVALEDFEKYGRNSYLMNLMDGIVPVENLVFLASTNHSNQIDDALKNRPGRFDRHVVVGPPPVEARKHYITAFSAGEDLGVELDRILADTEGMSFGHLKELITGILVMQTSYDALIKRLKNMTAGEEDDE